MKANVRVHKYSRRDGTPVKKHNRKIDIEVFKSEKDYSNSNESGSNHKEEEFKIDESLVQKNMTPAKAKAFEKEEKASAKEYKEDGYPTIANDEAGHSKFFSKEAKRLASIKPSKDGYIDFKSKEDYNKWLAYGHIHGQFKKTPGNQKIRIGGKVHKVKHNE